MKYKKLELKLGTISPFSETIVKTNIDVPKEGIYYINYGKKQIKVKLIDYQLSLGIENKIVYMPIITIPEENTYAGNIDIKLYTCCIGDLFDTANLAYGYYLENKKEASLILT